MAKVKRRKLRRNVTNGVAHIQSTFNNTTVTITDSKGDTCVGPVPEPSDLRAREKAPRSLVKWLAQQAAEKAAKFGVKELEVRVKGPGSGRESAISALQTAGMTVKVIEDVTPHSAQRMPPSQASSRLS